MVGYLLEFDVFDGDCILNFCRRLHGDAHCQASATRLAFFNRFKIKYTLDVFMCCRIASLQNDIYVQCHEHATDCVTSQSRTILVSRLS